MSRLFMVRHGPTHAKSMVGWSDLPADLSDTAALERLDAFLPTDAILVSSDLSRAVDTATAIQADRHRLPHDAALREIHFGDWELQHFTEVEDQTLLRRYWEEPGDVRPPNGETWHEAYTRVTASVDQLLSQHAQRDIVIVAHFGAIVTQIQRAERLTAYEAFGHHINNLSVTEFEVQDRQIVAKRINHNP